LSPWQPVLPVRQEFLHQSVKYEAGTKKVEKPFSKKCLETYLETAENNVKTVRIPKHNRLSRSKPRKRCWVVDDIRDIGECRKA
jgi:hypothetical protein